MPKNGVSPQQHSQSIDRLLGLKAPKIEQALLKKYRAYYKPDEGTKRKFKFQGTQTWIGLHPQTLQTPHFEILNFLYLLKKFKPQKVVDLGAGYGRVGLVLSSLFPQAEFLGFEIVEHRLKEAIRLFDLLQLNNCQMVLQNILSETFVLPQADVYFIYDFSEPLDVHAVLKQLSRRLKRERFFLVAKGESVRTLIQLKFPEFWVRHGVIHRKNWSLYSSFTDLT